MATASSLLSGDKFLCCICMDVFTRPVTTPCGHNFCSACIHTYWDGRDTCQCPLCRREFPQRPELQVNTFVSELAAEFKALVQVKASTPDPLLPGTADVLCDIYSEMISNIQKMTQSRYKKIAEIERSVDVSQAEAEKEKEASVQVFTDLIRSIQRSHAELVWVTEERHGAAKQKAEDLIRELRVEVAELESRRVQLEQLSQSKDHHYVLQSFLTLCSPSYATGADTGVRSDPPLEATRGAVTLLKQRVDVIVEKFPEIKMKRMREHAVDLTFDPDTAYCSLVISPDGKQVRDAGTKQNLPSNPKRFETCRDVLAKEGFTAERFYFEVQVKGNTEWLVGVVRESVARKVNKVGSVQNGYWTIGLYAGEYRASTSRKVKLALKEKLQNVGVFVDYNKGEVSFFDVNSKSHVYSFTGYHFREKLFPYFYSFQANADGAPLIITPVPQTH